MCVSSYSCFPVQFFLLKFTSLVRDLGDSVLEK